MALCPSQCANFTLTDIASAACTPSLRLNAIKRIMFYKCDIALPKPLTCANLEPLFTSGAVTVSNLLANVEIGDPTFADRVLSDCLPLAKVVENREVTFEDRLAVDVDNLGAASPFADWAFWENKRENSLRLNYAFVMCDGSLIIPRSYGNDTGLAATFQVSINYEKLTTGQGAIEFKKGSILFVGDPFDFKAPELNLNDCPTLAQYA